MRWSPEGCVDLCAAETATIAQEPTAEDFGAALVRDLRNPLSTIEKYLDLLAAGGVGPLTVEQLEYLDVARRNVQRLSTVITDWVDVSRIEADQVQFTLVPVDLAGIVAQVAAELEPDLLAKEHRLTIAPPADSVMALGDRRAVKRVVRNLLSNAHKYTQPGGSIGVALTADSDRSVRLDVVDSGIGIAEEDQHHIFTKFFRARLTDAAPGTGLGLALTKALVDLMGGQISLSSALGKGSTFSVTLPRVSGEALAAFDCAHTDGERSTPVSASARTA
jgi:signal transduction histidine kinase